MAAVCVPLRPASVFLLLLTGLTGLSSCSDPEAARGKAELQRMRSYAAASRFGDCWTRALEHLGSCCSEMTSEGQSRVALRFTHCHLLSSGRDFPACPEGSEVSRCTAQMDVVAFNAFTEFFTHTHSICYFLQSESWRSRAHSAIFRLTESSAAVSEQLQSTKQMAEDLMDAQKVALQAQHQILSNGEELRTTLQDSTQGLHSVFSELSVLSQQQQLAVSELFNRVTFLQSFLMMEAHSMSSCLYNAAALAAAFLLTATTRTSRARLLLLALVCLNFYLERKIYEFVTTSDLPEHQHMEVIVWYVSLLRRLLCSMSVLVLLAVILRHRDPLQQSLMVLQQLQETQRSLQVALQHAENLGENQRKEQRRSTLKKRKKPEQEQSICESDQRTLEEERPVHQPSQDQDQDQCDHTEQSQINWSEHSLLSSTICSFATDATVLANTSNDATLQNSAFLSLTPVTPSRPYRSSAPCARRSSGSPLVYSVLVEDKQSRYRLRSRRSETPTFCN